MPARRSSPNASAGRLESAVRALRRFHRSPPLRPSFPVHRVVEWHARDAGADGASVPASYERLHQLSRRIEAAFARPRWTRCRATTTSSPANVLFDETRAWLVDFECGGNNDVFFDLANLSVNCGFGEGADDRLLELYFGRASAVASPACG